MSVDPEFATIGDLADRLRSGELSPSDLVTRYADRISTLNTRSKAFISVDIDNAVARAESLSAGIVGRH